MVNWYTEKDFSPDGYAIYKCTSEDIENGGRVIIKLIEECSHFEKSKATNQDIKDALQRMIDKL